MDPTAPDAAHRAARHPRLSDEQIQRVEVFGQIEQLPAGHDLFAPGDRSVDMFVVLDGHIDIYEPGRGTPQMLTRQGQHEFTGELDMFNDRTSLVGARMSVDGRVVRLSRPQFRRLLTAEPDIAEVVMRAFIERRSDVIRQGQGAVTVFGPRRSAESLLLQRFLRRNGHPYVPIDPDVDPDGAAKLADLGLGDSDTPVIVCGDEQILVRPTTRELGDCLGIAEALDSDQVFDVAVVGAGPAGLASAVYAASEGLQTIVLEADAPGGQAGTSSRIENYLGFPTGISGQALADRAQTQAQRFGARIVVPRRVIRLQADQCPYTLELDDGTDVHARAVILATGVRYRRLELDDLERFEGSGIHYAATAVEAALCEGEEAAVVGGGNSSGQAVVFLSRRASHVHVLVRSASLAASMSQYLVSRIEAAPERITVHVNTEITALEGGRYLEKVTWTNRLSGVSQTRRISNVFLMLGAVPNTEWLAGTVDIDAKGFIRTGLSRAQLASAMGLWRRRIRSRRAAQGSSLSATCGLTRLNVWRRPLVRDQRWYPPCTGHFS